MKALVISLLILTSLTDPAKIGRVNRTKSEARKAYLDGDYKTAAARYQYLVDSLEVQEDEVLLNLAHARFQLHDTAQAKAAYQRLTSGSTSPAIRSAALQQLGVMANRAGKPEEALGHFKEALKAEPGNREARYNFELLKKKLEEQKKQEQQQNQPQKDQQQSKEQQKKENQEQQKEKSDQQKQEQQQNEQQKSEQQQKDEQKKQEQQQKDQQQKGGEQNNEKKEAPSASDKPEQMKISEEKANMLLEAMRNQEMQYLQQMRRKPSKPKDKGKPDW